MDVARWIAASLGYDEDKIKFTAIPSANREQAIVNGDIDYYVGTYSITDKRKEQISFAGPYFVTGQGLLVAAGNDKITGKDSLTAEDIVCSATGSTSIQRIKDETPAQTKEYDTYSICVEDLKNGQVDAVTTDEAILIGYAAQAPDELKVVGDVFSEERYGVGIAKGDTGHGSTTWNNNGIHPRPSRPRIRTGGTRYYAATGRSTEGGHGECRQDPELVLHRGVPSRGRADRRGQVARHRARYRTGLPGDGRGPAHARRRRRRQVSG